ncbi:MAG: hypothetical protein AAFQ54_01495 [Pseudomonadota bacterium]
MKATFALVAALAASPAAADPDAVSVLLGAHHLGADGFEEFVPGVFLTWRGTVDVSVGAYRNSYAEPSVSLTGAVDLYEWQSGAAQVFGGLAYYENADTITDFRAGDFVPLLGLQLRQGPVFSQIIPLDGSPVDGIITVGLTFPLD